MAGMPFSGMAFVRQKSAAVRRETWFYGQYVVSNGFPTGHPPKCDVRTFSSRVSVDSFCFATTLASCTVRPIFCAGLAGAENSVFGVELVVAAVSMTTFVSELCESLDRGTGISNRALRYCSPDGGLRQQLWIK